MPNEILFKKIYDDIHGQVGNKVIWQWHNFFGKVISLPYPDYPLKREFLQFIWCRVMNLFQHYWMLLTPEEKEIYNQKSKKKPRQPFGQYMWEKAKTKKEEYRDQNICMFLKQI